MRALVEGEARPVEEAGKHWFSTVLVRTASEASSEDIKRAKAQWAVIYGALSGNSPDSRSTEEPLLAKWVEHLFTAAARGSFREYLSLLESIGQELAFSRVRINSVIKGGQAIWIALCDLIESLPEPPDQSVALLAVHDSIDTVLAAYYEAYAFSGGSMPGAGGSPFSRFDRVEPVAYNGDHAPLIASHRDLDELLPQVLGRAVSAVGAESGSLLLRSDLVDDTVGEWVLTTTIGLSVPHSVRFPRDARGSNELAASAEGPIVISSAREWGYLTQSESEFVERCGIRSAIGVSLRSSTGENLGVLFTNSGREGFFDKMASDDVAHLGRMIGDSLAHATKKRVSHTPIALLARSGQDRTLNEAEERLMSALLRDRELEDVCAAIEESSGCSLQVVDQSQKIMYASQKRDAGSPNAKDSDQPQGISASSAERPIVKGDGFVWGRVIVRGTDEADPEKADLSEAAKAAASGIERWERARASGPHRSRSLAECLAGVLEGSLGITELNSHPDIEKLGAAPYRAAAIIRDPGEESNASFDDASLRLGEPPLRPIAVRTRGAVVWIGSSQAFDSSMLLRSLRGLQGRLGRQGVSSRLILGPDFDSLIRMTSIYNAMGQTAEIARRISATEVIEGNELGVDEMLLFGEIEFRDRFVNRVAGDLLQYDRVHGTDLGNSLAAYFEYGCNIKEAADQLFVHPNTLRYRLGRAETLVPGMLDTGESRLNMQLALKLAGIEIRTPVAAE